MALACFILRLIRAFLLVRLYPGAFLLTLRKPLTCLYRLWHLEEQYLYLVVSDAHCLHFLICLVFVVYLGFGAHALVQYLRLRPIITLAHVIQVTTLLATFLAFCFRLAINRKQVEEQYLWVEPCAINSLEQAWHLATLLGLSFGFLYSLW